MSDDRSGFYPSDEWLVAIDHLQELGWKLIAEHELPPIQKLDHIRVYPIGSETAPAGPRDPTQALVDALTNWPFTKEFIGITPDCRRLVCRLREADVEELFRVTSFEIGLSQPPWPDAFVVSYSLIFEYVTLFTQVNVTQPGRNTWVVNLSEIEYDPTISTKEAP